MSGTCRIPAKAWLIANDSGQVLFFQRVSTGATPLSAHLVRVFEVVDNELTEISCPTCHEDLHRALSAFTKEISAALLVRD